MKSTIHFSYLSYDKQGKKIPSTNGIYILEIPELNASDAPIAIVETYLNETRLFRWWKHQLWFTKYFDSWHEQDLPVFQKEMELKGTQHLLEHEAHRKISAYQDKFILVDGITHYPLAGEPRIVIRVQNNTIYTQRLFHYCLTLSALEHFRVDAYPQIMESIEAKKLNLNNAEIYQDWHHQVLIPDAIQLKPAADQQIHTQVENKFFDNV